MSQTALSMPDELMDDASAEPVTKPANYRWLWTQTGLDCHESDADCFNCVIYKMTGRHKDDPIKTCHQQAFNQQLIQRGIKRPVQFSTEYKGSKRWVQLTERECYTLRLELFRLVSELEHPTNRAIIKTLLESQFLGRNDWTTDIVNGHMERLKKAGVLGHKGRDKKANGALIWEALDSSKIPGPDVQRPKTPMPQMILNERSAMRNRGRYD